MKTVKYYRIGDYSGLPVIMGWAKFRGENLIEYKSWINSHPFHYVVINGKKLQTEAELIEHLRKELE